MPIHDWTRVEAGIFHHFHHRWISAISDALNAGLLPDEYYALAEQHAPRIEPDVLTLQERLGDKSSDEGSSKSGDPQVALLLVPPKLQATDEADYAYYRRKAKSVVVRHVSDDRIVAVVEIVSPGNKSGRDALYDFVRKSVALLNKQIHLLTIDLHPPKKRDKRGIHGAIWKEITGRSYRLPADKPLTVASYECDLALRAYVVHAAVGQVLPEMPLFLEPQGQVPVPLEAMYQSAFDAVPRRWRRVLEESSG